MSEERELPAYDPDALPDPTATGIAIGRASAAVDGEVVAFLRDQRLHLHEQFRHLREQLRLRLWEQRMGVLLRVATMIVGTAVAGGFGLLIWDAAHSSGLIIEPFSVPPAMAERGLNGQVIASQMIDKLTLMTRSESSRAVQSYANNWGDNIKVEIPETGVSIGELRRFLTDWLGHDIRISGEVYRTESGIAVTARTGGNAGATYFGKESDLDGLVQKAAEHIYEVTQPYRYANYLDRNYDAAGLQDRVARATAIYRRLIAGDNPLERAWAWNGLGTIAFRFQYDNRLSAAYYRKSLATTPDFTIGYYALSARNGALGEREEALENLLIASNLLHRDSIPDLNPHYVPYARLSADDGIAGDLGDFAAQIPLAKAGAELPDDFSVLARGTFISSAMTAMAHMHDLRAVSAYARDLGQDETTLRNYNIRATVDAERQDWTDLLAVEAYVRSRLPLASPVGGAVRNGFYAASPLFALAHAELGDFAAAWALVAPLTADDDDGLSMRARIAELAGLRGRADFWFGRAEAHAPLLPFPDTEWGAALLARGQPDAAIGKFERASKLGPKFADPLEGWGEALMAKNNSDLALTKFAEAAKYAPNWGRLHLKWGEALSYAGKTDEAKKQIALAAGLDLSPSEKTELAKVSAHG